MTALTTQLSGISGALFPTHRGDGALVVADPNPKRRRVRADR
ncbi:hypothetical protein [Candidatus Thiosymbion oneisti]|nr:hypothetical protein [Candidatus Thiosymbion oneisti]